MARSGPSERMRIMPAKRHFLSLAHPARKAAAGAWQAVVLDHGADSEFGRPH
jgi:hypothetical protein